MAGDIIDLPDRTLTEMNKALVKAHDSKSRGYIGASGIGTECERRIWCQFHWVGTENMTARSIKAIADGHHSEAVMIQRLRMVPGVTLITEGDDGHQIGFEAGHFRGHADGIIIGIDHLSHVHHVWEHKCCNEKKVADLHKLKNEDEASALENWDIVYYAQAQVYMHMFKLDYHYITVCTPGSRDEVSCVTAYNKEAAVYYSETRPKKIIDAERPPPRISETPAWYQCKFCPFTDNCHASKLPLINCRTCAHSTPRHDGTWFCDKFQNEIDDETQRIGCMQHLFNPSIVPGQQVDAGDGWVEYKLPNGKRIVNQNAEVKEL